MSNDMESMRVFADQLWKYMVPKLDSKFASNVSYFRAQVVSNPGNNTLEVQRPMENGTLTLPCVRAMSGAQAGQQVVALVMGSMSNAIIVGDGKLNVPGGGGDAGIANFQAQPDGSLVITLTNGTTFTATPHDPTKQDVLTFDDAPTQGSSNPVKSGGIYTALNGKADNAFANVKVGSTTIAADNRADTLTLVGDGLVTVTGNATNDSVTISVDPNHTHITTQVLDLVNADSYGPSGMVSFDADVAEVPLKNCVVNIEPAQAGSGTPSPTNVRAISGWTGANVTRAGKNFADCSKAESGTNAGITYSVIKNEEGSVEKIVANGTITGRTAFYIIRTATGFPAGNYIFTAGSNVTSNGIMLVVQRNRNGASVYRDVKNGNDYPLDIQPTDEIRLYLRGETSGTVVNNVEIYPMMRLASETDRTFEPYQGETIDYTFPSEAGTVYGGTLDVLKGTLTVDRASVTITGGLRYYQEHTNHYRFNFNALDGIAEPNSTSKLLSDIGVPISAQGFPSSSVGVYIGSGNTMGALFLNKSLVSPNNESANAWVASHPVQIVYPLETPITYKLSPQIISTLLGNNNIWDDCGTISVDYGAFLSALDKAIEEHSGDDIRHITEAERTAWDGKQDALTFDDVPTAGSSNPVKSSGIKTALDGKANTNHTHDASDIVSGILPAARGGTGNGNGYIQIGQKSGTTLGTGATAEGQNTTASGAEAHAEGYNSVASGDYSHAEGTGTASANSSHAEGSSEASGKWSHAEGSNTTASGNSSHTEGSGTTANKAYAHAEGYQTTASGNASHSEGNETVASGSGSHSEGVHTTASGDHSHAEGYYTTASGINSHAEGRVTTAAGADQHVFGRYNASNTTSVEIVGWGTSSTPKNIRTLSNTGNEWIAGTLTQASDARLKDVQGEIPDLSSVRAVRFRWKNGDDKEHLGYLAQDVEEIAPYLVGVDSNGYKSLDYIALLTAKVEMLEMEIEKLKQ